MSLLCRADPEKSACLQVLWEGRRTAHDIGPRCISERWLRNTLFALHLTPPSVAAARDKAEPPNPRCKNERAHRDESASSSASVFPQCDSVHAAGARVQERLHYRSGRISSC